MLHLLPDITSRYYTKILISMNKKVSNSITSVKDVGNYKCNSCARQNLSREPSLYPGSPNPIIMFSAQLPLI